MSGSSERWEADLSVWETIKRWELRDGVDPFDAVGRLNLHQRLDCIWVIKRSDPDLLHSNVSKWLIREEKPATALTAERPLSALRGLVDDWLSLNGNRCRRKHRPSYQRCAGLFAAVVAVADGAMNRRVWRLKLNRSAVALSVKHVLFLVMTNRH